MRARPRLPSLPVLAALALLGAGCGGGSGGIAGNGAASPVTVTASPSPTPAPASSPAAPTPASAPAAPTPQGPPAPEGFAPCSLAAPPPAQGEPPPSHNGPGGACEVARILLPASGGPCTPPPGRRYGNSANCPLLPDLAAALDRNPFAGSGGGAQPLCRCQNTWQSAAYAVTGPGGGAPTSFTVRVVLSFGPGVEEAFDIVVDAVTSGSLASDLRCAGGDAATSIKAAHPGPCG